MPISFSNSAGGVKDKHVVELKYASAGNSILAKAFEQCLIAHMIGELKTKKVKIDLTSKEVKRKLLKQSKIAMKQFIDDATKSYDRLFNI